MNLRNVLFTSLLGLGIVSAGVACAADAPSAKAAAPAAQKTVVLVHGAFADGSSWNSVIPLLQARGLKVVSVQNPLTSLSDDVQFTKRVLDAQTGPVTLVGHSWAGTVITEAGLHDKVKSLVYVAAFAPSAGQSTAETTKGYPAPPGLANPIVDAQGFLTLSPDTVSRHFAQDVSPQQANLIAVTQGAVRGANFDQKVTNAAWQTKPSWYVVAKEDHMIQPDLQRAFAKKINARTTELASSHVPMLSKPQDVANVIAAAADATK